MRIAMVGPFGFHPKKTMRSRALRLARSLIKRGHDLRLIMPPWHTPEEAGREWRENGASICYTSLRGGMPGTIARMVRETLAWRPDLVHAFKPKAYSGLVAWWLWSFRRHSIRLVTDSDDWEGWGGWNEVEPYSPLQKRFFAWQERWGLGHCHALTVASKALQSLAWARGVPPDKVVYLPNGPGIEVGAGDPAAKRAELGLADRPVVLLYSRHFEFETSRLVDVLARVKAVLPELAILSVGAPLYDSGATDFGEQVKAAGLAEALVDAGWVKEGQLAEVLAVADVGLYLMDDTLLNRTKCPVKLADMLAVGLPVVAEAVGQVPEYVVQQETGLLRPSGDGAGMVDGVLALLKDESLRRRLGTGAKAHITANFSWEHLAETAETAYVLAGSKRQ